MRFWGQNAAVSVNTSFQHAFTPVAASKHSVEASWCD